MSLGTVANASGWLARNMIGNQIGFDNHSSLPHTSVPPIKKGCRDSQDRMDHPEGRAGFLTASDTVHGPVRSGTHCTGRT